MKVRFLFDENMNPRFRTTLRRHYPEIDALQVGEETAPPLGASDASILHFLERTQRILVTDNRRSMPDHVRAHRESGHRHWGIFFVRRDVTFKALCDALSIYWEATDAEEWIDAIEWVSV